MDANKVSLQNQQLAVTLAKNDAKDVSSVAKKVGDSVVTTQKPESKAEFLKKGNEEVAKVAAKLGETSGKPEAGFLNQIVKPTSVFTPVTTKPETGKAVVAEQRSHIEGMSTKDNAPKLESESKKLASTGLTEPKESDSKGSAAAEMASKIRESSDALLKYMKDPTKQQTEAKQKSPELS